MDIKLRQTLGFVFKPKISGLLNPFTCVCLADESPFLSDIRAAIEEREASWVAGPTGVSGLTLHKRCGAELEHDKEIYDKGWRP